LIDDEADSIAVLRNLLRAQCPDVTVVGEAGGIEEAIEAIGSRAPDVLLLDISIHDQSAFDLLNRVGPGDFQVVFVTAHDDHGVRAIKYNALDYLLKPVDEHELRKAIDKVAQRIKDSDTRMQWKSMLDSIASLQQSQQKIGVPTMAGLSFIHMNDILRLEAKSNCTAIFMSSGERILSTRTIKDYESLLPTAIFCRVHSSHIVNVNRIQKYQKGRGGSLIMEDGRAIEVATRRRDSFLRRLIK